MDERVRRIDYRGKTILYGDYSGLQQDDFIRGIDQLEALSKRSARKQILHLLNFTDCVMSSEARKRANRMVQQLSDEGCTIRTACFGVKGLQRVIANAVKRDMYFGKNEQEAKDWLVQDT